MADFAVTVTNQINCLGASPSTLWNGFSWGSGKWGEGTASLIRDVEKLLAETVTISQDLLRDVELTFANDIASTFEMASETLQDGSGYYYVFIKPSSDAENRASTTYTQSSDPSTTWTSATVTGVSWTEV